MRESIRLTAVRESIRLTAVREVIQTAVGEATRADRNGVLTSCAGSPGGLSVMAVVRGTDRVTGGKDRQR